jgi:hypothetical protein
MWRPYQLRVADHRTPPPFACLSSASVVDCFEFRKYILHTQTLWHFWIVGAAGKFYRIAV